MKRRFWFKVIGWVFGAGLLFVFLYCLPSTLSRGSGKYFFLSLIQRDTGLSCEIEELHLSWFGPQLAKKVRVIGNDKDKEYLSAEQIKLDGSLWCLFLSKRPKGIFLSGWSLSLDEASAMDDTASYFDPDMLLPCVSNSAIVLEHGTINLRTTNGEVLVLSGIYLEKSPEKLIAKGVIGSGDIHGRISIESVLKPRIMLNAELQSVPTSFIRLFVLHPALNRILSEEESVNLEASAKYVGDKIFMTATVQGEQIQGDLQGYLRDSTFYIVEGSPSFIELQPKMASALWKELISLPVNISSEKIHAHIAMAAIPLNLMQWENSTFSLESNLASISLSPQDPDLSLNMRNIDIIVQKTERYTSVHGSALTVFGGAAQSDITGDLTIDNKKQRAEFSLQQSMLPHTYLRALFPKDLPINLPLEVPYYSLDVHGEYKNAQLTSSIQLKNSLFNISCSSSGTLQTLLFQGDASYHLEEKWKRKFESHFSDVHAHFSGRMQIAPSHVYFPKFSGKITAGENEVAFHGKFGKISEPVSAKSCSTLIYGHLTSLPMDVFLPTLSPLQLAKAQFSFHTDGAKLLTKGNLQLVVEDPENPQLSATRILIPEVVLSVLDENAPLNIRNVKIYTSGECIDLPIDRILKIQKKEANLAMYTGGVGDLSFSLNYNPQEEDQLVLNSSFKTDSVRGDMNLIMDDSLSLSSKTHGSIQWEVTPERYVSFFKNASCAPSCTLHRTAVIKMDVSRISCAEDKQGLACLAFLDEGGFEGFLSMNPLIFYDHIAKETFVINNLTGLIRTNNANNQIQYELQGGCLSPSQDDGKTSAEFLIKGAIEHPLNASQRKIEQTAEWKHIPSSFITGIFPISPGVKVKISSLAGKRINVSIRNQFTQGSGPITVRVDSTNLQAYIPLILTEKAILLEDDMEASLHINEEINQAFFQEFNPLISGSAYSQHPVLLRVNKQNFYLPISPYSFEEFHIQSAILDFGKISIANTGTMYDLFHFVDIEENKQFVESWFTPIFFSVQKGSIICKRFDALIDNRIRLALWGKTDILKDRISMTLGIDPEIIKKYFNNTSLKTKDFFLIKIRGSISSPEVDWSSAYARIALLKSYTLVGPFNNFADKLFSTLGDSTPPQTITPLPWEVPEEGKTQE